jgi:hypothetical protein
MELSCFKHTQCNHIFKFKDTLWTNLGPSDQLGGMGREKVAANSKLW